MWKRLTKSVLSSSLLLESCIGRCEIVSIVSLALPFF